MAANAGNKIRNAKLVRIPVPTAQFQFLVSPQIEAGRPDLDRQYWDTWCLARGVVMIVYFLCLWIIALRRDQ